MAAAEVQRRLQSAYSCHAHATGAAKQTVRTSSLLHSTHVNRLCTTKEHRMQCTAKEVGW
jgi:hypothetical protein